jgi:leader peptidase (prepilin peptidase)/N-methyltransferase
MIIEYLILFIITALFQFILLTYIGKDKYKIKKEIKMIIPLIAGILSLLIYYKYGHTLKIAKYILIIQIILSITAVDLSMKLIPDRLNIALFVIGIINLFVTKSYYSGIMSFFISGLLFLGLALITGGIGGGDVKLIAPLGLIFGIIPTLYLICYSFIVAGAVSIILMITKKAKMGTEIALAPYIGIATIIIIIGPLSQAL